MRASATSSTPPKSQQTVVQGTRELYQPEESFAFYRGGRLPQVKVAYETWGRLSAKADNAILILSGLSPSAHARSSSADTTRGWWERMVGPGLAIDTDRFYVICVNHLGSCFGSTGPTDVNPDTGRAYGIQFPELSMEDLAQAAHDVVNSLGIQKLHGLVGPSMGGLVALAYALQFPGASGRISLISSAPRPEAKAIAVHSLQREAIRNDPQWDNGAYTPDTKPLMGMRLARKIGMTSYRSAREWEERFGNDRTEFPSNAPFGTEFQVESYLDATSARFTEHFDANSYLYLSRAMDLFDSAEHGTDLVDALSRVGANAVQVIGVETDTLFPLHQQHALAEAFEEADIPVQFVAVDSNKGHDAFLVDIDLFAPVLKTFLE